MSSTPTQSRGAPDPDVQELAAKHDIPVAEAENLIRENDGDRSEAAAAAEKAKQRNGST